MFARPYAPLRLLTVAALCSAVLAACDKEAAEAPTGEVRIALAQAPGDVRCVRVGAISGGRTYSRSFAALPGQASTFVMPGLPTGPANFSADAFGVDCSAVTPATVATWLSDTTSAVVQPTATVTVTLTMHRPGATNVVIDFGGAGGASGSAPSRSESVSGGSVVTSPNFRMTYVLGQPSPAQGKLTSTTRILRGGVMGVTGRE